MGSIVGIIVTVLIIAAALNQDKKNQRQRRQRTAQQMQDVQRHEVESENRPVQEGTIAEKAEMSSLPQKSPVFDSSDSDEEVFTYDREILNNRQENGNMPKEPVMEVASQSMQSPKPTIDIDLISGTSFVPTTGTLSCMDASKPSVTTADELNSAIIDDNIHSAKSAEGKPDFIFDLRRAVIDAEIMAPKYKEYE